MKSPKARKPLFERLKAVLEEAMSHARGEITLRTTTYDLPEEPPEIDPETLVALQKGKASGKGDSCHLVLNVLSFGLQTRLVAEG